MVDFPPDRATANTSQQLCGLNSRFLFFSLTIPICYGTVENGKEQFIVLSQGSQLRNSISLQAPILSSCSYYLTTLSYTMEQNLGNTSCVVNVFIEMKSDRQLMVVERKESGLPRDRTLQIGQLTLRIHL